jgi:DNA-binding CsgD family transcriptional regulator
MPELQQTLLALYRTARETPLPEFCDAALRSVNRVLGFDTAKWGLLVTGTPEAVRFNSVHLYADDPRTLQAYAQIAHEDFAALAMVASRGTTLNLNMAALCKAYGRKGLRAYTRSVRHDNALVSCTNAASGFFRSVSLYKAGDDNQFSERQRQACEMIFPHLLEAQAINLALGLPALDETPALRRWPMAVCDAAGCLHHADAEFLELLRRQWARLEAHRLPEALQLALLERGQPFFKGEQVFVAQVSLCAGMHVLKARARHAADALTPRELEVARQVARGLSHKEAAEALGLSPATTRNHIQRIHEKLGVRSNLQLAGALDASYPMRQAGTAASPIASSEA